MSKKTLNCSSTWHGRGLFFRWLAGKITPIFILETSRWPLFATWGCWLFCRFGTLSGHLRVVSGPTNGKQCVSTRTMFGKTVNVRFPFFDQTCSVGIFYFWAYKHLNALSFFALGVNRNVYFLSVCRNRCFSDPEHHRGARGLWLWLLGDEYRSSGRTAAFFWGALTGHTEDT